MQSCADRDKKMFRNPLKNLKLLNEKRHVLRLILDRCQFCKIITLILELL